MKRVIFGVFLLLFVSVTAQAQFTGAKINVIGLTCSACSFGTERSIRQLSFVSDVKMDLESNLAVITFKPGEAVSMEQLVQKVYDAGFSVGKITATYHFTNEAFDGKSWTSGNDEFRVLGNSPAELKGDKEMTFVGEKYLSKKELKKWKDQLEAAKSKSSPAKNTKVYYVYF